MLFEEKHWLLKPALEDSRLEAEVGGVERSRKLKGLETAPECTW